MTFFFQLIGFSFYYMIYPVALVAILVINHWIAKVINVSAGLPGGRVHKNSGINAHYVFVHLHHAFPPVVFNIFLQLTTPLAIIVHGSKTVVYFARRKYKAILLAMRYDCTKLIVICCHNA